MIAMPALSFQPRLIKAVMNGTKPGTIRQLRKSNLIKPGDVIYIFTGMRTKQCKRHGEHVCAKVYPIAVDWAQKIISIDGVVLIPIVRHWFACTDIQGTEDEFFEFFRKMNYKQPLVYICWNSNVADMIKEWLTTEAARIVNSPLSTVN